MHRAHAFACGLFAVDNWTRHCRIARYLRTRARKTVRYLVFDDALYKNLRNRQLRPVRAYLAARTVKTDTHDGRILGMHVTPAVVAEEYEWVRSRSDRTVPLINEVREDLGELFETTVDPVTDRQYHEAAEAVFADGDLAVNVAALVRLLRELDVDGDYPGFIVDELLGRELAGMLAGTQPLRLLGEATFHYADVHVHDRDAGADDLDAALAAGFQTRLPGWDWTEGPSPFTV